MTNNLNHGYGLLKNVVIMRPVFSALCLLLTICSAYPESSTAEMTKPSENLRLPPAQWQNKMALRYANFSPKYRMASEPRPSLSPDLQALKKREGIRKTIDMIGFVILLVASLIFASLGGAALSKTSGSEGRKKGIKLIIIAGLLTVLWIYWDSLMIIAMSLLSS